MKLLIKCDSARQIDIRESFFPFLTLNFHNYRRSSHPLALSTRKTTLGTNTMENPQYLVSNLSDADRGGHTAEAERLTTLDTDQDLKTLRASHNNSLDLFVDLLLLSCSIAFIVFAGILGHLNGQPVGSKRGWNNVQNLYNKVRAQLLDTLSSVAN